MRSAFRAGEHGAAIALAMDDAQNPIIEYAMQHPIQDSGLVHPQPSTFKPQHPTLNPQPSTLNPQPSTIQPSTIHPQPVFSVLASFQSRGVRRPGTVSVSCAVSNLIIISLLPRPVRGWACNTWVR